MEVDQFMKFSKVLLIIIIVSIIMLNSGCAGNNEKQDPDDNKIKIYTTLYVLSEFSQKIGGSQVEVVNLVPPGVSPHDFEPTAKDIIALTKADIFLYNGAGMEGWVEKVLDNLKSSEVLSIDASNKIELRENDEEHDHDEESHDEESNIDAHVWLNPLNALKQAEEIKNALIQMDSENKTFYEENYQELKNKLTDLDKLYASELKNTNRKDFFMSHAAFGYLAEQYGLTQNSISGVIPADEPSPAEMVGLIKKAKELNIKYILIDPRDVVKISEVLADEIGAETIPINTVASLTKEELAEGLDYFKIMEDNLINLKKVLNE